MRLKNVHTRKNRRVNTATNSEAKEALTCLLLGLGTTLVICGAFLTLTVAFGGADSPVMGAAKAASLMLFTALVSSLPFSE